VIKKLIKVLLQKVEKSLYSSILLIIFIHRKNFENLDECVLKCINFITWIISPVVFLNVPAKTFQSLIGSFEVIADHNVHIFLEKGFIILDVQITNRCKYLRILTRCTATTEFINAIQFHLSLFQGAVCVVTSVEFVKIKSIISIKFHIDLTHNYQKAVRQL
jgi:hypothetical protein